MGTSLLQNAIDLLDQGQPADAIRVLRPLTQRLPNYPSPFILLARAYEAEGNWKAATATWQHVNGLVAESPVVAAGMKRGRTRLAEATLRTVTPAPLTTPHPPSGRSHPESRDTPAASPRAWEWPEGLINEYAELRDPGAEASPTPSAMPDSPVVKKLLARLGDADRPSPSAPSSLPREVETPTDSEEATASPERIREDHQETERAAATASQEAADPPVPDSATETVVEVAEAASPKPSSEGTAIAAGLLDETEHAIENPDALPAQDAPDAPGDRAKELAALLDAPDDKLSQAEGKAALEGQTALPFDAQPTEEAPVLPNREVSAEPEPVDPLAADSGSDPISALDSVFEFDPAATASFQAAATPTADDLVEGYDDLDALIESLEGARIRPRPDLDDIPPPDLDDDIEDVVSETLARIYAGQRKHEEAARVYEKLAEQQPERAAEFTEKAALVRGRTR